MKLEKVIAVRNNKTVYRDGDKAIKVFDEGFKKSDVLNEALNHARVEETALHIPKLYEVGMVDGKWAIVMEFIQGKTLARLMEEQPERHEAYMNQFVDLQLHVHAQTCPLLSRLRDKMNYKINLSSLDATTRYDLHLRLEALPRRNKLCHGDFNTTNVIIASDGTPYILDWSHATQGNASADAARTYLLYRLAGDDATAEEYLKLFCQKSGAVRQYVEEWIPVMAASQSVKGKLEERQMLLQLVESANYR